MIDDDRLTEGVDDPSLPDGMPDELIAMMAGDGSLFVRDARIVRIDEHAAWIDVGSKFESSIPLSDWNSEETPPRIGDELPVVIDDDCNVSDRPLKIAHLVFTSDPIIPGWMDFGNNLRVGQLHSGQIGRLIKGGFLIDIGVNVFLPDDCATPAMLADRRAFIGDHVTCRIVEIDNNTIRVALQ